MSIERWGLSRGGGEKREARNERGEGRETRGDER